ncbi:M91 family zinc metallopeptidase [Rhodocytophaga aerolata]|uniref:M91 family zinc metallopeptidase n=1 Tax=Rhodocytophaga aerolata TaxID=455078 RepID=A0ABT8RG46_9BACT|nr:M91 family zinc metallopeptidase [Rhodocytophaga aerolata]MDO1451086.1 M91 family zinc metallopeptidase [Rhodocytophaga aerolata]
MIAIDPDGKDIFIITQRNEDGTVERVKYSNGKLYNADGKLYTGNHAFARKVQANLNNLKKINDEFVQEVISTLETSKHGHYMEEDEFNQNSNYVTSRRPYLSKQGIPMGSRSILTLKDEENLEDGTKAISLTTLAHELRHMYDHDQGKMKGYLDEDKLTPEKRPKEIRGVNFENRVRYRIGLKLRTTYGDKKIDKSKLKDPTKPNSE